MSIKIPKAVEYITSLLQSKLGAKVYIVGGFVRDLISNTPSKDIDLATDAPPTKVMEVLSGTIHKNYRFRTLPIGLEYGTVVIIAEHGSRVGALHVSNGRKERFEITTLRRDIKCNGRHVEVKFTDKIEADLERRDFTINSIALQIDIDSEGKMHGNILDPFNGQEDLTNRLIRAVGDPMKRFQEDFLRPIRACRFAGYGDRGLIIEPVTYSAMCEREIHQGIYNNVAKERIQMELKKILKLPKPSRCFNIMKNTSILRLVVPPLAECVDVEQGLHHGETVFDHCIAVCEAVPKHRTTMRLAGLLHDIGKPRTKKGVGTSATFYGHEHVGAEMARKYMGAFNFSKEECKYVELLISNHMYHFDTDTHLKTIKKWMQKLDGNHFDLVLLRMADRIGNKAKKGKSKMTFYMKDLIKKMHEIQHTKAPLSTGDLAISGKDLINELKLKPGPIFGKIMKGLLEHVLEYPEANERDILLALAKDEVDAILAKEALEQEQTKQVATG